MVLVLAARGAVNAALTRGQVTGDRLQGEDR